MPTRGKSGKQSAGSYPDTAMGNPSRSERRRERGTAACDAASPRSSVNQAEITMQSDVRKASGPRHPEQTQQQQQHGGDDGPHAAVVYKGRITGSLHGMSLPPGGIALIADIQYADASTRNDSKLKDKPGRMYSQTLGTFTRSLQAASALRAGSLILLGDQVDDRDFQGDAAAAKVLEAAEAGWPSGPVGYLLGNHDTKWTETFREARKRSPVPELPGCFAWECEVACEGGGPPWVIIALDCYATSFAAEPGWGKQLPMNGEVGDAQLAWLSRRLRLARDSGKLAVVLSHTPLHPGNVMQRNAVGYCGHKAAACATQAVKDHVSVQRVLQEAGNVKLCIAGHDHPGAYFEDETGIHYWTLEACLFANGPPEVSGAVLRLCKGYASLHMLSDGSEHRVRYPEKFAQSAIPAVVEPPAPPSPSATSSGFRLPVIFDMETGDPDDVLTLLFLAAHAAVDLKAVTITQPGSRDQVALVRWLLKELNLTDVRVGALDWPKNIDQKSVNGQFYRNFGSLPTAKEDCEVASQVLVECCDAQTTLLTGGSLENLASALSLEGFQLGRWVAQGGFAGEGVVPCHLQMDKFQGKKYARTYNFGQDPRAAKRSLLSNAIGRRVCVSKNVCHRTLYADGAEGWHTAVAAALAATRKEGLRPIREKALKLMHGAMCDYLKGKKDGKMMHDPLALAVALDESVCTLVEVELDTQEKQPQPGKNYWGSKLRPGSGTWISIDYSEDKFRSTLLQDGYARYPGSAGGDSYSPLLPAAAFNEVAHNARVGTPEPTQAHALQHPEPCDDTKPRVRRWKK